MHNFKYLISKLSNYQQHFEQEAASPAVLLIRLKNIFFKYFNLNKKEAYFLQLTFLLRNKKFLHKNHLKHLI